MPKFSGTGPRAEGPMTGGGFGNCGSAGSSRRPYGGRDTGFWDRSYGRGRGSGKGRFFGRGFGPWCGRGRGDGWERSYGTGCGPTDAGPYAMNAEDELSMLRDEANAIKEDLDAINKRIEELEKGASE